MAKRKQTRRKGARASPASGRPAEAASDPTPDDQISYSALSLHQLFEQQARQMLDRTDLDESSSSDERTCAPAVIGAPARQSCRRAPGVPPAGYPFSSFTLGREPWMP